jgi:hypothetical protein
LFQNPLHHLLHCHHPAMAMNFHHVFPSETAGRAHQQQQHLIQPTLATYSHHMAIEDPMAAPLLITGATDDRLANLLSHRPR